MLCYKMPGLEKCETYFDSLIEITIEHEGKTPVVERNQQQKFSAEFSRQSRGNQKDFLFSDNELIYQMGELLSEFRHQELLLNFCLLLGLGSWSSVA